MCELKSCFVYFLKCNYMNNPIFDTFNWISLSCKVLKAGLPLEASF